MYVCHCNRIPERDIRAAIEVLASRPMPSAPTAADVLSQLHKSGKCLGCFPLIEAMLSGTEHGARLAPVPEMAEPDAVPPTTSRRRRGGAFARRSRQ